jgi:TrmH family RNA methyltransferase
MTSSTLDAVRVVLVEPSHPGNIGAAARAMWAMEMSRLYLVRPKHFPSADATARAAGADSLLYEAVICDSLDQALDDCVWVVGTTVRTRHLEWPRLSAHEWAREAVTRARDGHPLALVFGREQAGLSNQELDRGQAIASIATNPHFASLNLAAAVQIFAYELHRAMAGEGAMSAAGSGAEGSEAPVTAEQLEGLYGHLEQALADIDYYDPEAPKLLMRRLRQLFGRARLDRAELNIVRGILAAAQRAAAGARRDS